MSASEEKEDKLRALRDLLADYTPTDDDPGFYNDSTLKRYLVARDWDVHAGEKMLRETLQWREETKPQSVVCPTCKQHPGCNAMRQIGFDRQHRPVFYCGFVQCSRAHVNTEESLDHTMYLLENAARSINTPGVHSFVWVMDFTAMRMASASPRQSLAVERVLSHHYPERLGAIVCVNHGFLFQTVWRAIRPFIDPKTAAKVYMHRSEEKVREEFTELFPDDLRDWLLEEIHLNKQHKVEDCQKQFWKGNSKHDPRGCPSYVSGYLDTFNVQQYKDGNIPHYLPHVNIVQELCGELRQ